MNKHQHQCGNHDTVKKELIAHLPFSIFSVIIGVTLVALLCFIIPMEQNSELFTEHTENDHSPFLRLFELFHYMHILFSGAATTALLVRKKTLIPFSLIIGIFSSVIICLISDSLIPWVASSFIQKNIPLHICIIEHFPLTLSFSILGSLFGVIIANTTDNATILSHSAHVMFSTLSSLFYIISFTTPFLWLEQLHIVFFFTLIAVTLPCCLSDFYIPMIFVNKRHNH